MGRMGRMGPMGHISPMGHIVSGTLTQATLNCERDAHASYA